MEKCTDCDEGYQLLAGQCVECSFNCLTCKDENCLKCEPGLYVSKMGTCVDLCAVTHFENDVNGYCT